MKKNSRIAITVSLIAFCLNSCTWIKTKHVLTTAETLMADCPDSALSILIDIDSSVLRTRPMQAKHALLLSMALDKNYIDIADDSIISIAYNYYQNHPTKREKMLSFYYSGVVKQNAGNTIRAAIDFNQALSLAKELNDNHNAGLACRHLSTIHSLNNNHQESLRYSYQAVSFFESCGESLSADYSRTMSAMQLLRAQQWNESISIIDDVLSRNTFQPLIHNALMIKADALIWGRQDYIKALECINKITVGKHYSDTLIYYGYKGLINAALGRTADSKDCFDIARSFIRDAADTLTLYDQLSRAYRIQNDYKNAYNFLLTATDIQNKQIIKVLGQSVTGAMEQWYRESYNTQKERTRQNTIIYSILGVLLLLIILGLILFVRKLHIDRLQDMADIESLNNDLQVLKERNEHFRKACNAVIMDKVQFLHQLSDSYFSWTDEEVKKREKRYGIQTKDELISVLRQQLGGIRTEKRLIISLEEAVNSSNDNLIQRLRTEYRNKLKEEDFSTLTLLYSGLSVKSIAFYLRITEPALRTRKTRYKHLFEENPTPSSEEFIQRLSNGDSSLRSE